VAELSAEELRQARKFEAVYKPAPVRPTGQEIFDSMSPEEQDEMIGAAAAEAIRQGEATLADFVERVAPGDTPGFIRQKPVADA
jgi:hypothetical protein